MKFCHLPHFLGVAFAAPSKGKADTLSIFDNPTIPWTSSDSLSLPFLSHVRRAATSTVPLNVSSCQVTVTVDPYWYPDNTQQATLYITSPINSPGTKNGANIFELYLRVGSSQGPGGLIFTTNQVLVNLDSSARPFAAKNLDVARTNIASTGAMVAYVDYANLDRPELYSPTRYNNEKRKESPQTGFEPPKEVIASQESAISVTVKDKGVITGGFIGYPLDGKSPFHAFYIKGVCSNSLLLKVPVSS